MRPIIKTELPGPNAQRYLADSRHYEPRSMSEEVPIVWKRGERVWIEDVDGNVFLDFTSGVLVTNVGHAHPKLVVAMREQAGLVTNCYDFVNEWRPTLARKLVEITPPNLDKAIILTTGAEAVEAAVKMARKYGAERGRYEIVAFHGGFHGRTYGALSLNGKRSSAGVRDFGPFLPGVVLAPFPYRYRCPWCRGQAACTMQCFDFFEWVIETESEKRIAAVLVETYQGAAGSIIPPVEWFQRLERWCQEHDALLIIDEVQASFGRTGKMFGFEHYGIRPNLLCLGKGISSSVPVSAVVGESRVMDLLPPGSISSTHGGNAFCARVALANIEIIEQERLVENAARVGAALLERCKAMAARYRVLGEARGMGLVLGLEIVKEKESREPAPDTAREIVERCYRRGLLMIAPIGFYGNVLRIAPPLVITHEEAMLGADILEQVLAEVSE
ncbi:MAG: aspartate aminotransferase family protein [Chloroflexota bacterium]